MRWSEKEARETADRFESKPAEEILRWAAETFSPKIALASSFGAEDVAVIDLLSKIKPRISVFTLDTGRTLEVPIHLKDASYPGAKRLGHGEGYKYAHDHPGHHVEQDYLPECRRYYDPTDQGFEKELKARLSKLRKG